MSDDRGATLAHGPSGGVGGARAYRSAGNEQATHARERATTSERPSTTAASVVERCTAAAHRIAAVALIIAEENVPWHGRLRPKREEMAQAAIALFSGAVAGASVQQFAADARTAWRRLVGERYSAAQERRYALYAARFPELPPLSDGCPQAQPWGGALGGYAWGSDDSDLTLTRERRALGQLAERAYWAQRNEEEARISSASPEAHLLAALVRWCGSIDRAQPADDLLRSLGEMQAWLSHALRFIAHDRRAPLLRCARLARAGARLGAVRAALAVFDGQADRKLAAIRLSQHRDRLRGELDQALCSAGIALYYACCERPLGGGRASGRELLASLPGPTSVQQQQQQQLVAQASGHGGEQAGCAWELAAAGGEGWLRIAAPLLHLLLGCRTDGRWAAAGIAARAFGHGPSAGCEGSEAATPHQPRDAGGGAVAARCAAPGEAQAEAGVWSRGAQAAALGRRGAALQLHLRSLGLTSGAADETACALREAARCLVCLGESASRFERACSAAPVEADPRRGDAAPALSRVQTACAELREAHAATSGARRALSALLVALSEADVAVSRADDGGGLPAAEEADSGGKGAQLLSWLEAVLPSLAGGRAGRSRGRHESAWRANWAFGHEELLSALAQLDGLRAAIEAALHALAPAELALAGGPGDGAGWTPADGGQNRPQKRALSPSASPSLEGSAQGVQAPRPSGIEEGHFGVTLKRARTDAGA